MEVHAYYYDTSLNLKLFNIFIKRNALSTLPIAFDKFNQLSRYSSLPQLQMNRLSLPVVTNPGTYERSYRVNAFSINCVFRFRFREYS